MGYYLLKNFQALAIEVLRRTIKEYHDGDTEAMKFLFDEDSPMSTWAHVAGIEPDTVRARARDLKPISSYTVSGKQSSKLKHRRVTKKRQKSHKG